MQRIAFQGEEVAYSQEAVRWCESSVNAREMIFVALNPEKRIAR